MSVFEAIEILIIYALKKGLIGENDTYIVRNNLTNLLDIEPEYIEVNSNEMNNLEYPSEILNILSDYALKIGLIQQDTVLQRDLFETKVMGFFTPRQSEIEMRYIQICQEKSKEEAIRYFYDLAKTSNYIRVDRLKKDISWSVNSPYGNLEICINMSKPEFDPKDIIHASQATQNEYPKCLLCIENVGYFGRINYPARQNLRVIPLCLADEKWYLQYSPYGYFNEHCIAFSKLHTPMCVTKDTFVRMFDFIEQVPGYFIGANAGLAIVGGSILSHDHYQGGKYSLPVEKARTRFLFKYHKFPEVDINILDWCVATIRLNGYNKDEIILLAAHILEAWESYDDYNADILSNSQKDNQVLKHNAVTPALRIGIGGKYELDLVLRNNRTTHEFKNGIFHPHENLHHIKKENIGVIEVLGRAILPGRLNDEFEVIKKILSGIRTLNNEEIKAVEKHAKWIDELSLKYGLKNNTDETVEIIRHEVGVKYLKVLEDVSVFKNNLNGVISFKNFLKHCGFVENELKNDN
jgi:UDPglucose--hexose-1-phosphate uridylyltransferase